MFKRIFTFLALFLAFNVNADLFSSKPKFLTSDDAFIFSSHYDAQRLSLQWQIADGYYLYKKEIAVVPQHAELGDVPFPTSEEHDDEFFGKVEIYRNQLALNVPIKSTQPTGRVEIRYQGCTKGFCYPPETKVVELQWVGSSEKSAKLPEVASPEIAKQTKLATDLNQNTLSIFWFFVFGLGLAFTPCVLPMLPLLSSIVIGARQRPNSLRAFLLSLTYVQGMALTYTLLGLTVAAIGLPFQVALQSPPVLIGLSLLFVLLALSMFGVFSLELPHSWQQKLNQLSQQQQGGAYSNVFVMGMIAGLVASPCTSAPLSGALLYVAQSGDLLTGGLALYLLALGMGVPLVLITLFGNKILPKSGDWLLKVKTLFGFVMLALPIFLLSRLLPIQAEPLMWSALAIAVFVWLLAQFTAQKAWQKGIKAVLFVGIILSGKPWTDLIWQPTAITTDAPHFERISTLAELQQKLTENQGKKVMLDLYADWCVACKEFEKYTFSDPKVKTELDKMRVLQVDMTRNSPANDELMTQFQVLGLPTILFFDENGKALDEKRVTGFMQAPEFLNWLNAL